MTALCPCCGSPIDRPFLASIDTGTIATALGAVKVPFAEFDVFASISAAYPGAKRHDQIGVEAWGEGYFDKDPNHLKVLVSNLRRRLRPIGIEILTAHKRAFRLVVNAPSERRRAA